MKRAVITIFLSIILIISFSQDKKKEKKSVYKMKYAIDIPVTAGLFGLSYFGYDWIDKKMSVSVAEVEALHKDDVWFFDRVALNQTVSQRFQARDISDWSMNIFLFSPVLLYFDKDIRKDWLDVALLYLETQSINSNLYAYGGPLLVDRIRPLAYYDELSMEEKRKEGTKDSFFSGHASWTAGASFFMAKVISDYHPELGPKKWFVFLGALAPPMFVGYFRIRGLKHFPTDVMLGTAVGAATGVLVPHLHKRKIISNNISIAPFAGDYSGFSFRMKF